MKRIFLLALAALCLAACGGPDTENAVVSISSGKIQGTVEEGIFSFKGVPYATAERFQPSVPLARWDGVRECKEYGPWAKQAGRNNSVEGEGDFLANIWTSGLKDNGKRPIMVWIHGGGFSTGASNADPTDGTALAQKGVVLVSINHRLDIMGFLDLSSFGGKWENSVNVGMLDIVTALKWIKKNAKAFGGDPENITIFGQSGGGGKVGTLLCMPEADGLFQKAIIQSGAKINITTKEISEKLGKAVVAELGLTEETLDEIQTIEYEKLSAAGRKCQAEILGARVPGTVKMWGFVPTPDGKTLLQQPYTPGFAAQAKKIPVMIGTTFNELERTMYRDTTLDEAKGHAILESRYGDRADEFAEAFYKAFPDASVADMLCIDSNMRTLSIASADAKSAENEAPVYMYFLTWTSENDKRGQGCYHGLDISLSFNNPDDEHQVIKPGDPKAAALADKMSDLWVSFAKSGVPSAAGVPEWPAYNADNGATLILDNECVIKNNFDREVQGILYDFLK